jgi:hypothetical protein
MKPMTIKIVLAIRTLVFKFSPLHLRKEIAIMLFATGA